MIKCKRSMRSRVHTALTSKSAEAPRQRIGVVGGTLDPIRNGHLVTASEVADCFDLDFVPFVSTSESWQKRGRKVSYSEDRCPVTVIVTTSNSQLSVSRADTGRSGATYTVDTLRDPKVIYPNADLFFITNTDALRKTMTQRDQEEMFDTATFVGVTRPGVHLCTEDLEGIDASRLHLIEALAMAISSTDYRKRAGAGRPVWHLMLDGMVQYITKCGLYQSSEGAVDSMGSAPMNLTSEDTAPVDATPVNAKSDTAD